KAINIKFPLTDDVEKNRLFNVNNVSKDALTSNLLSLLLTDKGERYYEPDYGTNLRKYLFEPKDNLTESEIESDIKETVRKYIPKLTIKNVSFLIDQDEFNEIIKDYELKIIVDFSYSEDVFSENGRLEITI